MTITPEEASSAVAYIDHTLSVMADINRYLKKLPRGDAADEMKALLIELGQDVAEICDVTGIDIRLFTTNGRPQ
jgi:hypothetical protein